MAKPLHAKVDHIAIVVSDIGRSSAFYGSKLGMVQVISEILKMLDLLKMLGLLKILDLLEILDLGKILN